MLSVEIGDIFCGIISSISAEGFHVVESDSVNSIKIPEEPVKIWWFVSCYEPFLLRIDDGFFRAVRVPLSIIDVDETVFMEVYLVDTGESFALPIIDFNSESFELPEESKGIPSLAYYCQFDEICFEDCTDESQFLKESLYRKFTFEIIDIEADRLTVNIHPYDNQAESDENLQNSIEASDDSNQPEANNEASDPQTITMDYFNPVEQDIWESHPFSTENPEVAVQGFATNDDDRLCQFYDPNTGGCWKRGQCNLRHKPKLEDGACRDQDTIFYHNIEKVMKIPPIGSKVMIKITTVISTNTFWCIYRDKKRTAFNKLRATMNNLDEIAAYRPFNVLPTKLQLVFAKVKDGIFYRGRVDSLDENNQEANVFLVDLGVFEKIFVDSIFNWVPRLANDLAFQAVEMEIANIQPLNNDEEQSEAVAAFNEIIDQYQNKLKAVIFENVPAFQCKLLGKRDDIGESLVDLKLALPRNIPPAISSLSILPV